MQKVINNLKVVNVLAFTTTVIKLLKLKQIPSTNLPNFSYFLYFEKYYAKN